MLSPNFAKGTGTDTGPVSPDSVCILTPDMYHQVNLEPTTYDNSAFELDSRLDLSPLPNGDASPTSTVHSRGRSDTKTTRKRLVCSVLILIAVVVVVVVVVIVAVVLSVNSTVEEKGETTMVTRPPYNSSLSDVPDLEGSFRLMTSEWDLVMGNVSSDKFKNTATKYEAVIHKIYQASRLSSIVLYSVVHRLSQGSIVVFFQLYLVDPSVVADPATLDTYRAAMAQPELFSQAFQEGLIHLLTSQENPVKAILSDISLPSLLIQRVTMTTTTTTTSTVSAGSSSATTVSSSTTTPTQDDQQPTLFPEPVESCGMASSSTSASSSNSGARILGGSPVGAGGRYPWVVMVWTKDRLQCGGSVMDPRHVITAAHCIHDDVGFPGIVQDTEVVAGEDSSDPDTWTEHVQRVSVARVYRHREFNKRTQDKYDSNLNDIAVLRLTSPLTLNGHVSAICLPQVNDSLASRCTVVGWGVTSVSPGSTHSSVLQKVTLSTYNSSLCRDTFATSFQALLRSNDDDSITISSFLGPGVMCAANGTAGGLDACSGDSGGPLFCGPNDDDDDVEEEAEATTEQAPAHQREPYRLFGLVSWGEGCALPGSPGFYTYLPHFIPWLHRVALPVLDLLVKVGPLQCLKVDECASDWLNTATGNADNNQHCSQLSSTVNCSLSHPVIPAACEQELAEREARQYAQYVNLVSEQLVMNLTTCHHSPQPGV